MQGIPIQQKSRLFSNVYLIKSVLLVNIIEKKYSYSEISDDYSADDAMQNFEDDFDSIDR